jgi:hypothetical protein
LFRCEDSGNGCGNVGNADQRSRARTAKPLASSKAISQLAAILSLIRVAVQPQQAKPDTTTCSELGLPYRCANAIFDGLGNSVTWR